jgi:hypothetical protein
MATALRRLSEQVFEAVANDMPWRKKAERLRKGVRRKFDRLVADAVAQRLGKPRRRFGSGALPVAHMRAGELPGVALIDFPGSPLQQQASNL